MGRLAVVLFVLLCFGMAGGTYLLAIHQPTRTMQQAERIEGTVVSTDIEYQDNSGDGGASYAPVVTYEYTVDGTEYTNDRYSLVGSPGGITREEAASYLDPYSAGTPVSVYIVPDDPTTSFLERGSTGLWIYAIVGALGLFGALGVFALVDDLLGLGYANIK